MIKEQEVAGRKKIQRTATIAKGGQLDLDTCPCMPAGPTPPEHVDIVARAAATLLDELGGMLADVEYWNCKKTGHLAKICASHIFSPMTSQQKQQKKQG